MSQTHFHPAVAAWFEASFAAPTGAQLAAWPAIRRRRHTLIAAPTGSGKTLAAFLTAIDDLVREGLERGLEDETHVLYVSPLKALSNDIHKNLEQPLAGIRDRLLEHGLPDVDVRALVRTGDTPQSVRERMRRQPPHIVVTTPESLYILLTSESGRKMLSTVRTVIVDELHAVAGNKRGAHLALSLERLAALTPAPPLRIGLSATQKPMQEMANFLTGGRAQECSIVDTGHVRARDLAIELTGSPLEAVMAAEAWAEVYDRLAQLVSEHRTTLIFVNTRRLAERAARFLAERIGEEHVTAHHGSLAKDHRLDAEQRLKGGALKALVATASLELGIDIGDVDLVCQLGSPRSIAAFLQRVGRSGHAVGATPKGRLFPLSRDDLVECAALIDAVRRDELDRIHVPPHPLDVLAQQIVAEVAGREWGEDELYAVLRRAWPYRDLSCDDYDAVLRMLAEGYSTRRGRRGAWLHHDRVNRILRPRRGARLTAITNGGAIPDQFDYEVILSPEDHHIGSLNEDFAFESLPGDIFQLGNTSYRILKIEQGKVYVADAKGQPPNIPFWFGEAPGRSDELSASVSRLRQGIGDLLDSGAAAARDWLLDELKLPEPAALQLTEYLAAVKAALGVIPTQDDVVFERFFDENGDTHFVIHAPFGSRINRAWGLSLRKRFCRRFNFELQAAATEDSLVLSLGPSHSFPLEEVKAYLNADTVRGLLIQALLDAPMFATRWRWCASIALAVQRFRNGRRLPAQWQRSDAEDLVAVVFPDQLACLENIAGDREVPDHPLVQQTLRDCLTEVMDIDGLERLLRRLQAGEMRVSCRELAAPSPLSLDILNARPYAFLDDAPAEERRTLAVQQRRYLDVDDAAQLGRLDAAAIDRVCAEAWPDARTADELHDALVVLGFLTVEEGRRGAADASGIDLGWGHLFADLQDQRRATRLKITDAIELWAAAERLPELRRLFPQAAMQPQLDYEPGADDTIVDRDDALRELLRSRLEGLGPVTATALAAPLGLTAAVVMPALAALEQEGFVMQGRYRGADEPEWCERRLLARIHRYTLKQLRSEIEPVSPAQFMRFLFYWQHLDEPLEGEEGLAAVLAQLEGYPIAAAAWESEILPARLHGYGAGLLDNLCSAGRFTWLRLAVGTRGRGGRAAQPVRNTPVMLLPREHLAQWHTTAAAEAATLSSTATRVAAALREHGASFFLDLVQDTGLLRTQVEAALGELVAQGQVTADSFAGLRALITPAQRRPGFGSTRRRRGAAASVGAAGRWALLHKLRNPAAADGGGVSAEHFAQVLLLRYGIVFRRLLERESHAPPWRELLYTLRRMEARGELRGGRFVSGMSGEQFALPEAVGGLRELRRHAADGSLHAVSAVDPLNLAGIVTPGERVAAQPANRVLYRDGVPVALTSGGETRFLHELDPEQAFAAHELLLRGRHSSPATPFPSPRPAQ